LNTVEFEGKQYADIEVDTQNVLRSANIYTFRYFYQDHLWMASDASVERFGLKKFYKITSYEDGPALVYSADIEKDKNLYNQIRAGKNHVSTDVRSINGEHYHKVSLSVISRTPSGEPDIIIGLIEDFDENMESATMTRMLADEYFSVYNVDFERDKQVIVYKILGLINEKYGDTIFSDNDYSSIIANYINGEVVEEERSEMLKISSYEYLNQQFKKNTTFKHDYRILRDGQVLYMRFKAVKINSEENLRQMVLGFASVNEEKNDKLERLAFFDQVTLGNNYNYFSERLKSENRKGYIVSLDISGFKMVNDSCGIESGDLCLREVNKLLEDIIGDMGFFGHVNSDHFVMFLPFESENTVIAILKSITYDFKIIVKNHGFPKISPYFGVSSWTPGDRIQVMFSQANSAKHKIKDTLEANYGFYREEDNIRAIEIKRIEDAFDSAIENEQFEVWFQPKFSPVDGNLTGAEALVRWRTEDGELVSPGKFIPVYEKNGMIRLLDEYVFIHVCRQQKKWLETYGRIVPVSINLSRASLFHEGIVDAYKKIASSIGIDTAYLPIEITESAAISNSDIKNLADMFYEAGFPLFIDDFGTGYSSLSTLNMMRFDTLKLDKSLIDYIGEFSGESLIKHTIALAKDLGLQVTAEGVEHEYQVKFLKEVDCDDIQGFIYSKPLPAAEFEKVLS